MTGKGLFREIGNIDERYVAEAQETVRPVLFTPAFRRALVTAACLFVCVGLYFAVQQPKAEINNDAATMTADSGTGDMESDMDAADGAASNYVAEQETESLSDVWGQGLSSTLGEACTDSVVTDEICETEAGATAKEAAEEAYEAYEEYGVEEIEAFLAKVNNSVPAKLSLLQEETGISYFVYYDGAEFYVQEDSKDSYSDTVEMLQEASYAYLKTFQEATEDESVYVFVTLGKDADFELKDVVEGKEGTLLLVRYLKE